MSWNAPKGGNGDGQPRENCPADEYPALAIAIIDLGHQETLDFKDKTKRVWKQQVAVIFEVQGPKNTKGEPFYFVERYNFSLGAAEGNKAKLRRLMDMVGLPDEEDDIEKLLDKPFLLTIEEAQNSKDITYTRLKKDGVAKLPKAMMRGLTGHVYPPFTWRLGDPDHDIKSYNWLPYLYGKPIAEVVAACREMKAPTEPSGVTEAGKAAIAAQGARVGALPTGEPSDPF